MIKIIFRGKFKIRDGNFIFFPLISRYKNKNFTPTLPPPKFFRPGRLPISPIK